MKNWEFLNKINIDRLSPIPLYHQIFSELRGMIINEVLPLNTKLPSIRKAAEILKVNSVTIINAYRLLEDAGLARKKQGSGTFVSLEGKQELFKSEIKIILDDSDYDLQKTVGEVINFASASPDPSLFPVKEFQEAINSVLDRDGGNAFTYQEAQGYLPLRKSISKALEKISINVGPEGIYVISGAQQGIDIVSKALLSAGDYVFAENPTYSGALAAFESRNAKVITFDLEEDGPEMKTLEKLISLYKPKFIYTMPNFQNPTGCTWSVRKKEYFLWLCRKYDAKVVEDDYLSELNFTDLVPLPLKSYDKDNRVIYIKSFSKIFMPGLRVAYLLTPESLKEKIMNAKYVSDISTSGLMQRVLDIYMNSEMWERHLRRMRKEYSFRYITAVRSARRYLTGTSFIPPEGGLNLWIKLPEGVGSVLLAKKCSERGVIIVPGTVFMPNGGEGYFRLSFASVNEIGIEKGTAIIGSILNDWNTK